jgi:GMP reductase
MIGGMLAGHDECQGHAVMEHNRSLPTGAPVVGKDLMKFYGMSSEDAMEKYHGGVAEHRAAEGKAVYVPYRGPVKVTIQEILGGLRSACAYVGARELKNLNKRATFYVVNRTHNTVFGDG